MKGFHGILIDQIKMHRVYAWADLVNRRAFLQAVSDAYYMHDEEQSELRKSLDVSSSDLVQANKEMSAIIQALPDQFFRLHADGTILEYRPGKGNHLTVDNDDPTAMSLYSFISPEVAQQFRKAIVKVLGTGRLSCFEFSEIKDQFIEVRMFPVMGEQVVALVRDISERKYSEQRIAHLAYHDSLTGLPNRLLFKDRLELSIALARRHGYMVAVMFLDLDRFKHINDTLGHRVGDQLLVTIGRRLRKALRVSDTVTKSGGNQGDMPVTIARMGGDEFTVILSEVKNVQAVVKVARRVLEVVSKPLNLNGGEVFATVSIGIALFPVDGADFETLVKNADSAMYYAKERGRNNYQLYTESMNAAAVERLVLENNLHRAVERNELEVYYQPQKDLTTGNVTSMEALMRWRHQDIGLIGPSIFIPLAEESDLILKLGEWLIGEVCRQIRSWQEEGLSPCRIFINVSGQQVKPDHLVPALAEGLSSCGVSPEHLGIELTETAIVANLEVSAQVLREVSKMGIQISVDDFGTGYSSLSYLQSFPIDSLKIDQSFVRNLTSDAGNADGSLAGAIVALGHSLGLKVVAEGVENEEQLEFLVENGCDSIQGYLFCVPGPVEEISKYLETASTEEDDRETDNTEDAPDESPEGATEETAEAVQDEFAEIDPDEFQDALADAMEGSMEEDLEEIAEAATEETTEADPDESPDALADAMEESVEEDLEEIAAAATEETTEADPDESPDALADAMEESVETASAESPKDVQEETVRASTDS